MMVALSVVLGQMVASHNAPYYLTVQEVFLQDVEQVLMVLLGHPADLGIDPRMWPIPVDIHTIFPSVLNLIRLPCFEPWSNWQDVITFQQSTEDNKEIIVFDLS